MEYLVTYSWAILIIAVVLVALFQLGIFNTNALTPRASPGSCQVYRPNGSWSIQLISLTGLCSGELPQYVSSFASSQSAYVKVKHEGQLVPASLTITAWVNPSVTNVAGQGIFGNLDTYYLSVGSTGKVTLDLQIASVDYSFTSNNALTANSFAFVAATYDGTNAKTYINNLQESSNGQSGSLMTTVNSFFIGNTVAYFSGQISNVQVYNTSLTSNELQAMYISGIGGAPLVLQNLVGWWPLNGNANDYSGNNATSTANSISFKSTITGYTPP